MKFRDEVAKSTDGALKILKILLKVNGSAFNIKKLSDFTGFQRETVARNLGKLKKAGIVENDGYFFGLTDEFRYGGAYEQKIFENPRRKPIFKNNPKG